MDSFKIYTQGDILPLINQRAGEYKLGEKVQVVAALDAIETSSAKFVLLGIPEDIGVRGNYGIGGAKTTWMATLKAFLNIQHNSFLPAEEILVLGHFEISEPVDQSIIGLRHKTNELDTLVYPIIQKIVAAGKIPIIIGGGHNNAAPIIMGTAVALNEQLNVVNIDAHADLRDPAEGRHSGNGFSAAMQLGHLNQYLIFGLHQNYVHQTLPNTIENSTNINAFYFEELLKSELTVTQNWDVFIKDLAMPCGLEIDLDSIEKILSSAITPSGFALNDIRKILLTNHKKFSYLHICEGAVSLANGKEDPTTGKTIAYLVSDFIKALRPHIYPQP